MVAGTFSDPVRKTLPLKPYGEALVRLIRTFGQLPTRFMISRPPPLGMAIRELTLKVVLAALPNSIRTHSVARVAEKLRLD